MFGFFGVLLPLAMLLVFRRPWYFSLLAGIDLSRCQSMAGAV
jgi:hypothetical protein